MMCWMSYGCCAVLCDIFGMVSSSRMKFSMMAIYHGSINCSLPDITVSRLLVQFLCILLICIVLSVMIFLYDDHNKKNVLRILIMNDH